MDLLIISGSLNSTSLTRILCEKIAERIKDNFNFQCEPWHLNERSLPFHNPKYHHAAFDELPLKLRRFREAVQKADAIIFASPIYHNSLSGVLKNAIDHLTIEVMGHKPVGLISHGGNRSPQAVDHMRIIIRSLHAIAIPFQVCTSKEDYKNENNKAIISSTDILNRIDHFIQELINYARIFQMLKPA